MHVDPPGGGGIRLRDASVHEPFAVHVAVGLVPRHPPGAEPRAQQPRQRGARLEHRLAVPQRGGLAHRSQRHERRGQPPERPRRGEVAPRLGRGGPGSVQVTSRCSSGAPSVTRQRSGQQAERGRVAAASRHRDGEECARPPAAVLDHGAHGGPLPGVECGRPAEHEPGGPGGVTHDRQGVVVGEVGDPVVDGAVLVLERHHREIDPQGGVGVGVPDLGLALDHRVRADRGAAAVTHRDGAGRGDRVLSLGVVGALQRVRLRNGGDLVPLALVLLQVDRVDLGELGAPDGAQGEAVGQQLRGAAPQATAVGEVLGSGRRGRTNADGEQWGDHQRGEQRTEAGTARLGHEWVSWLARVWFRWMSRG